MYNYLAGTPGRVMHMIRTGALEAGGIKILVLDEVDVMLSRGFEQQVIMGHCEYFKSIMYALVISG